MSIFFPSSEFHEFMERIQNHTFIAEGYDSLVFERSGKPLSEILEEDINRYITISQPDVTHFCIDFFGNLIRSEEGAGINIPRKLFEISGVDLSDGQFDALHVVITDHTPAKPGQ